MTDLNQLERDLLTQVEAAGDEAALESVLRGNKYL